jgi:hypothetical protein
MSESNTKASAGQARHRRGRFAKFTLADALKVLSVRVKAETSEPVWARGWASEPACDWECGSTRVKQRLPPIFVPAV